MREVPETVAAAMRNITVRRVLVGIIVDLFQIRLR